MNKTVGLILPKEDTWTMPKIDGFKFADYMWLRSGWIQKRVIDGEMPSLVQSIRLNDVSFAVKYIDIFPDFGKLLQMCKTFVAFYSVLVFYIIFASVLFNYRNSMLE